MRFIIFFLLIGMTSTNLLFAEDVISSEQCEGYAPIDVVGTNTSFQNATPSRLTIGQTFNPTEDLIYGITLSYAFINFPQNFTLELRSGTIPESAPYNTLATVSCDVPSSFGSIDINFEFDTPVPVTIGGDYYFVVSYPTGAFSIKASTTNSSPTGQLVFGLASNVSAGPSDWDLGFTTYKCTPPPPPIPTMSQWMLFILGLIMTSLAVAFIKQWQLV